MRIYAAYQLFHSLSPGACMPQKSSSSQVITCILSRSIGLSSLSRLQAMSLVSPHPELKATLELLGAFIVLDMLAVLASCSSLRIHSIGRFLT